MPAPGEPPIAPPVDEPVVADRTFCKYHQKTPARFRCSKCNRYFCDLCVNTLAGKKTCRTCGVPCVPVQVSIKREAPRGFLAKLPGSLLYPFRGIGIVVLIFATLFFAGLGFISAGLMAILSKIVYCGFLFCSCRTSFIPPLRMSRAA